MDLTGGYHEWAPPSALAGSLACMWASAVGAEPATAMVLPDGCVDLIWQSDRSAFVAGPDTGPNPAPLPPGTVIVGARFLPGAGGPALGVPLSVLLNQRVDVADLRPDLAHLLPVGLLPEQALARLLALCARLAADGPPDPLVLAGARRLGDPRLQVRNLAEIMGVSDRQLRRRFDAAVGYGPKTLQRVLRFRRFLDRLSAPSAGPARPARVDLAGVDLARLALEAGYADQAHLTREAGALSGLTPGGLAALARQAG